MLILLSVLHKTVYLFRATFSKISAPSILSNIAKRNINARRILGNEMKLSQFHGQLSNNWLPLLLTCWPNSPLWFSARSRMELFISTIRTIGLVYRLPPSSSWPSDRPSGTLKINYSFGNYDDWPSIVNLPTIIANGLLKPPSYCACFSPRIFFPIIFFFSPFCFFPPFSVSGENSNDISIPILLYNIFDSVIRIAIT